MNLLVIGGGGREHAIVWKLSQSARVGKIYCSPGNGGIADLAEIVPACAENDWASYAEFARTKNIALTIVGPEQPLCAGIVDHFTKNNLRIFGPNKNCAQLEGSKVFSKNFMKKQGSTANLPYSTISRQRQIPRQRPFPTPDLSSKPTVSPRERSIRLRHPTRPNQPRKKCWYKKCSAKPVKNRYRRKTPGPRTHHGALRR